MPMCIKQHVSIWSVSSPAATDAHSGRAWSVGTDTPTELYLTLPAARLRCAFSTHTRWHLLWMLVGQTAGPFGIQHIKFGFFCQESKSWFSRGEYSCGAAAVSRHIGGNISQIQGIHLLYPSSKEPIEEVWKGEVLTKIFEGDWTNFLSTTFKADKSDFLFNASRMSWQELKASNWLSKPSTWSAVASFVSSFLVF